MSNKRIWIRYNCNISDCRESTGIREGKSYCLSKPITHKCARTIKTEKPYSRYNKKTESYTLTIDSLSEEAFSLLSTNYKQYIDESIVVKLNEDEEDEEKELEDQQITEQSPSTQILVDDDNHNHNKKGKQNQHQKQSNFDIDPLLEDEDEDDDLIMNEFEHNDKENQNSANIRTYNRNHNQNHGQKRDIRECIGNDSEEDEEGGNDEANEIMVCLNNAHLKQLRLNRLRKRRRKNETEKTKLSMGPKNELILQKLITNDPNPSLDRNKWNDLSRQTFLDKQTLQNRYNKVRIATGRVNAKGGQRGSHRAFDKEKQNKIANKIAGKVLENVRETPDLPQNLQWFNLK